MERVYDWVRNLLGLFLFLAILDNLSPGKSYQKYVRLFTGMVVILLVLEPLSGGLQLEERVARFYEALILQYEAADLRQDFSGIEKQRLEQMIDQYEQAVEADLVQMAEDMGFQVRECQAEIAGEEGEERFGTVVWVGMQVSFEENVGNEEVEEAGKTDAVTEPDEEKPAVETVAPVVIAETINTENKQSLSRSEQRRQQEKECSAAGKLRRRITSYYGLEETYVEIQVVEGEG